MLCELDLQSGKGGSSNLDFTFWVGPLKDKPMICIHCTCNVGYVLRRGLRFRMRECPETKYFCYCYFPPFKVSWIYTNFTIDFPIPIKTSTDINLFQTQMIAKYLLANGGPLELAATSNPCCDADIDLGGKPVISSQES